MCEFLLEPPEFSFGFGHMLLKPSDFAVDVFANSFEGVYGLVDVELFNRGDVVERCERHLGETSSAMQPYKPDEEFVNDAGIEFEIFLEIEDVSVIECGHDAYIVQAWRIALVVFDGVGVGVDDVRIVEHSCRVGRVALK